MNETYLKRWIDKYYPSHDGGNTLEQEDPVIRPSQTINTDHETSVPVGSGGIRPVDDCHSIEMTQDPLPVVPEDEQHQLGGLKGYLWGATAKTNMTSSTGHICLG